MGSHYKNWKWHYVPDDERLTWGDASARALLRRSPAYALGACAGSRASGVEIAAGWHDDLWDAVLEFCPLAARLRLCEASRGLRGFACGSAPLRDDARSSVAVHQCCPVSPVASACVGVDLARRACGGLAGPPDVVVLVAARPWAGEVPGLRRSIRAALPATACALSTTVDVFRDPDGADRAEGVALLALRLPRPLARGQFGTVAVSECLRAARPLLKTPAQESSGPSPDALDLVALLEGEEDDDDDDDDDAPLPSDPLDLVGWMFRRARARR